MVGSIEHQRDLDQAIELSQHPTYLLVGSGRSEIFDTISQNDTCKAKVEHIDTSVSVAKQDDRYRPEVSIEPSEIFFSSTKRELPNYILDSRQGVVLIVGLRSDQLDHQREWVSKVKEQYEDDKMQIIVVARQKFIVTCLSEKIANRIRQLGLDLRESTLQKNIQDIFDEMDIGLSAEDLSLAIISKSQEGQVIEPIRASYIIDEWLDSNLTPELQKDLVQHLDGFNSDFLVSEFDLLPAINEAQLNFQRSKEGEASSDQVFNNQRCAGDIQVIDPTFCYQLEKKHLPNLAIDKRKNSLRDKLVAAYDMDGTLTESFILQRLMQFLQQGILKEILQVSGAPNEAAQANLEALFNLEELIDKVELYKLGKLANVNYEDLIQDMNRGFAKVMAGLPVLEVCKYTTAFSIEDYKKNTFEYAEPLMRVLRHLGVVNTFITGAPDVTMGGYRYGLGIQEITHPMQLQVAEENGILRFTGRVDDHGGLAKNKRKVIEGMSKNNNTLIFFAGDTESDGPGLSNATKKGPAEVHGKAMLVANLGSNAGRETRRILTDAYDEAYPNGHFSTFEAETLRGWNLAHVILTKLAQMSEIALDIQRETGSIIHPGYEKIATGYRDQFTNSRRLRIWLQQTLGHPINLTPDSY